jgi:RNA polymerase sigma-70 factor (ECF subfamily)
MCDDQSVMSGPLTTCWALIRAAADGSPRDREEFAHRYAPVLRAYLAARWRGAPLLQDLDDAVQDVFVE